MKIFTEGPRESGNTCRGKYIPPPGNLASYKDIKSVGRVRQAIDDLELCCAKGVIFVPGNEDRNA